MPRIWITLIAATLAIASVRGDEPSRSPVKHVVLVSIDGLAAGYLTDPSSDLPTLRRLAAEGASARGMLASFPSVTWPSHVSLITGVPPSRHGVIGNSVWDVKRDRAITYIGDPELTRDQAIRVRTLYDAAHAAGLSCGSVIWPCCNGATSLKWVIPDSNKPALHAMYTTRGFADELATAGIDISKLGEWGWSKDRSTERDQIYTRVANYLLETHGINLLLVHLITPDGVEHAHGPYTREARAAVAESDARISEIWATLQKPPLAGNSTLFVVSDHGFAPYEKNIKPNVLFKELGLIDTDASGKVTNRTAWCVAQGGSAFIYLLDASRREKLVVQLRERLRGIEGVAGVLEPDQFARLGMASPETNPEAPHLILTTGPGYSFNDSHTGPAVESAGGLRGSHGHDPSPEYMHATFLAAGAGIKPGTKLDVIRNTDVAPTIARLLGITLNDVDGRVLQEILAK